MGAKLAFQLGEAVLGLAALYGQPCSAKTQGWVRCRARPCGLEVATYSDPGIAAAVPDPTPGQGYSALIRA